MSPRLTATGTHTGGAGEGLDTEPGDQPDMAEGGFGGVIFASWYWS